MRSINRALSRPRTISYVSFLHTHVGYGWRTVVDLRVGVMDLAMNDEASCFAGRRRCSGLTQASTGRHGHPYVRATRFSQRNGDACQSGSATSTGTTPYIPSLKERVLRRLR